MPRAARLTFGGHRGLRGKTILPPPLANSIYKQELQDRKCCDRNCWPSIGRGYLEKAETRFGSYAKSTRPSR